jgi:hypothetical protein
VEKINRAHKPNSLIPLEPQQIEVARDDQVRFAGESTGEDVVIVRVFLDNIGNGLGSNDFPNARDESEVMNNVSVAP